VANKRGMKEKRGKGTLHAKKRLKKNSQRKKKSMRKNGPWRETLVHSDQTRILDGANHTFRQIIPEERRGKKAMVGNDLERPWEIPPGREEKSGGEGEKR